MTLQREEKRPEGQQPAAVYAFLYPQKMSFEYLLRHRRVNANVCYQILLLISAPLLTFCFAAF